MPIAYYNEIDPYAAQWLRNLIKIGAIAPGDVDERSIEDVTPDDLRGYTQCHFFAGIGGWSYALRSAGWSDDRPVWTGSCPCQPFSTSGARGGFDDERHLWPAFHYLIEECDPDVVFGEQVAGKDALPWLDLVLSDLEATGYAAGAVDLCAAGLGAPHIRQRLYWLADADTQRQLAPSVTGVRDQEHHAEPCCRDGGMGHAQCAGLEGHSRPIDSFEESRRVSENATGPTPAPSCTNGFWRDADWLPFRDSKIRPIEPGIAPLVDGLATRMGLDGTPERLEIAGMLEGYGNAIVVPVAEEFIRAYMTCRP